MSMEIINSVKTHLFEDNVKNNIFKLMKVFLKLH